ncbi:MAG: alpha-1,4-glucan--maltose-1-phosphate maltosyltransferase, partial [Deltaproteobacteria bacterium]
MNDRSDNGRQRVIIKDVSPEIDSGRFPLKRTVGEKVVVEADIFTDGHDALSCVLLYRKAGQRNWTRAAMTFLGIDRWRGEFTVAELTTYWYSVQGWVDKFRSWRQSLSKKVEAGQDVSVDLLIGADLIEEASERGSGPDSNKLKQLAAILRSNNEPIEERIKLALVEDYAVLMASYPDKDLATTYDRELQVVIDREKARFSTWYEMFPRSCSTDPGKHGTFKDCETRLPYVAGMGFDVLYLPPIHPIGQTHRKGENNNPVAGPGDPGSPWAIGSEDGGHKAIHPELGTLEEFRQLMAAAQKSGVEIAIDIAFQCSPDHPYVKEHPKWFRWRPDKTVQYAENPPKKYEDIYPFDFESARWQELWAELKDVIIFWVNQGVRIFRVDNPHTKPFGFWQWVIAEVKKQHPEIIFLAEAFTRSKVMYELAKLGFTQSYTYFAWRNTKWELTQYFTELYQSDVREYFRANLWPNTPDILTEYLQMGGRPAFMARLVLAATLGANYGIYGPAFELCENRPREFGSEEYLDSEKYQITDWDLEGPNSLKGLVTRVNRIRRQNPALQSDWNLHFHQVDNEKLIAYSKYTEDLSNIILVVVNLDPHHRHGGWLELDLEALGILPQQSYQMHDLLSDARFLWYGSKNYVELDPQMVPAHIFRLRRRVRTER